jgi:uncharacterized phage infection (PIP) family protein YhgE
LVVATLKDETTTLKDDVATLKDQTTTLKDDVATLKDQTTTLKDGTPSSTVGSIALTNVTATLCTGVAFGREIGTKFQNLCPNATPLRIPLLHKRIWYNQVTQQFTQIEKEAIAPSCVRA